MTFMNNGMQSRSQRIVFSSIIALVIATFLISIVYGMF